MTKDYTKITVDYSSIRGLLSPRKKLDLEGVALGILRLLPGEGYTFLHSHEKQEEVYIVIEGKGKIQLNADLLDISAGDYIRVSAPVHRALCAGPEGITVICAGGVPQGYPRNPGARYLIDDGIPYYDEIPLWYRDDPEITKKNMELKARMDKSREKRTGKIKDRSKSIE